jgi:hypothetical protein
MVRKMAQPLTLSKAIREGRLREFIAQEKALGVGSADAERLVRPFAVSSRARGGSNRR